MKDTHLHRMKKTKESSFPNTKALVVPLPPIELSSPTLPHSRFHWGGNVIKVRDEQLGSTGPFQAWVMLPCAWELRGCSLGCSSSRGQEGGVLCFRSSCVWAAGPPCYPIFSWLGRPGPDRSMAFASRRPATIINSALGCATRVFLLRS